MILYDLVALEAASEHEMMRRSPTFLSFDVKGKDIGNARFIQAPSITPPTITASRSIGWRTKNFSRTASALFAQTEHQVLLAHLVLKPAFMRW